MSVNYTKKMITKWAIDEVSLRASGLRIHYTITIHVLCATVLREVSLNLEYVTLTRNASLASKELYLPSYYEDEKFLS